MVPIADRPVSWAEEYSTQAQAACLAPFLGNALNWICQRTVLSEWQSAYQSQQIDRVIELIQLKNTYKYVSTANAVVTSALIVASVVAGLAPIFLIAAPILLGSSLYSHIPGIIKNNELIAEINGFRPDLPGAVPNERQLPQVAWLH